MSRAEMTIEGNIYQPTDSLILPSPRLFYPAHIPLKHHQLRSLISFQDPDIVYYASDTDLYRLNTTTRKRALITTLPFSARSIAADHGWLCAAGHVRGLFAAVKLDDSLPASDGRQSRRPTDVDALLPILTESEVRGQNLRDLMFPDEGSIPSRRRKPEVLVEEFGREEGDIMNAVTIHKATEGSIWSADGTVAVLSNNDMTVRIYSLTQRRLLKTLDFPFCMNHASISPDGSLLMAVGDEAYVFFYHRVGAVESATSNPRRNWTNSSYKWEFLTKYELTPAPDPANDACFATVFSPSGQLCAVASQDGMTTVFDTSAIGNSERDAVIEIMPSSRLHSHTGEGAIRTMCFSPEPWDLLICAEHSGRVCVTDIRSEFRVRQTVKLHHDSETVESVEIHDDVTVDEAIDPRLRSTAESELIRQYHETMSAHDEAAAAEFAADYIEASAERRRLERQAREESPQPFTERERQMLDSLRTSRERIEARDQLPTSINYQATRNLRDGTPSLFPLDSGPPTSEGALATNSTTARLLRHQLRERTLDLDSSRSRPYEPQRRSSVILSQNESGMATASAPRTRAENSDRWRAIEAVMANSYNTYSSNSRLRQEGEALREAHETGLLNRGHMIMIMELERRNDRNDRRLMEVRRRQRLRSLYAEVEGRGNFRFDGLSETERESCLETAGCAMSRDGMKLFVGTRKGVFEYHVNIQGRKCFPKISFR